MFKILDSFKKTYRRLNSYNFPFSIGLIMFTYMIFYSMVSNVLFAFLPKMVKYFGASEVNTGVYAGVIASAFYIGQFVFSMVWGYLTDTMVKTNVLVFAGIALCSTTIAFGFCRDIYSAFITRFLQGCSMGQLIIFKSIITDICDDDNIAFGLSILMSAWTVGSVTGPSIGGFLAFPEDQYPGAFSNDNLFGKFSILLPNFVLAMGIAIAAIFAFILIPKHKKETIEKSELLKSTPKKYYGATETYFVVEEVGFLQKLRDSKFVTLMKTRDAVLTCILYTLFSMVDIGYNEILPILTCTSSAYRGMAFTPSQLGTVLIIAPALYFLPQLTVIPKLTTRFGAKRTFIGVNLILVIMYPLLPTAAAITNRKWLYAFLIAIIVFVRISAFGCSLSINILINNSVRNELLGAVNGVAMSTAALGRLMAPIMFGTIYSWSLTNIEGVSGNETPLGFPLNQFLTFYILSFLSLIIAIITTLLPNSIDMKKPLSPSLSRLKRHES